MTNKNLTTAAPREAGGYAFAEEITGLCRNTLYALVHQRRIPFSRISSRLVIFRRNELQAWLDERAVCVTFSEVKK